MYDKNVVEQIMASTGCEQDEAEGILSQIEDIANIKAVEAEMQSQASTSAAKNRLFKRKGVRSLTSFLCAEFPIKKISELAAAILVAILLVLARIVVSMAILVIGLLLPKLKRRDTAKRKKEKNV